MTTRGIAVVTVLCLSASAAQAQTWSAGGFVDVGATRFTASNSFEAVFGSPVGVPFGGGGEVVLPRGLFAGVRVSRFQKTGERVFVFEGETFRLGIDTDVRIVPIEVTGGYRFGDRDRRLIPYLGGGVGWHRYSETSEFAEDDENVKETHRGFHVLGGAELRVARWAAVAGEVQWTTVPDALGNDPNGAAAAFDEDDLGGIAARVKFVVGR